MIVNTVNRTNKAAKSFLKKKKPKQELVKKETPKKTSFQSFQNMDKSTTGIT